MYNFIYGYATRVVGSWVPFPPGTTENGRAYTLLCGSQDCYELCESTWKTDRQQEPVGLTSHDRNAAYVKSIDAYVHVCE